MPVNCSSYYLRRKVLSALILCFAIVCLVVPGVALATTNQYYGPNYVMNPNQVAQTSGFALRINNYLYRPAGDYGVVQYDDTNGNPISASSGTQNPVHQGGSGQSARSLCGNISNDYTYPTTCQTDY